MDTGKRLRLNMRKTLQAPRPRRVRVTRAVTPVMLLRSLKALQESKLMEVYFSSVQVAQMMAEMYPEVEQEFSLLHQEVKDKLMCAASAEIIGYKFDRGYHALSDQGCCAKMDTRSKLMFWMLYKKMVDQRGKSQKPKSNLFRPSRSS